MELPPEVMEDILLKTPYEFLLDACQTTSMAASICQDEIFWRKKIIQDFKVDPKTTMYPKRYNISQDFPLRRQYDLLYKQIVLKNAVVPKNADPVLSKRAALRPDILNTVNNESELKIILPYFHPGALEVRMNNIIKPSQYRKVEDMLKRIDLSSAEPSYEIEAQPEIEAQTGRYNWDKDSLTPEEIKRILRIIGKSYDASYPVDNVIYDEDNDRKLEMIQVLSKDLSVDDLNKLLIYSIKSRFPLEVWDIYVANGADDFEGAYGAMISSLSLEDIYDEEQAETHDTPPIRHRFTADDLDFFRERIDDDDVDVVLNKDQKDIMKYYKINGTFPDLDYLTDIEIEEAAYGDY